MKSPLLDLEEAFNTVGQSMYSDDFCCKLLAWVYIYGGGNEVVTQNKGMFGAIQVAQKRLNLMGGEIPNAALLPTLQEYMKQAEYHEKGVEPAEWVNTEINKRYGISEISFKQREPHEWRRDVFYTQRPKGGDGDEGFIQIY